MEVFKEDPKPIWNKTETFLKSFKKIFIKTFFQSDKAYEQKRFKVKAVGSQKPELTETNNIKERIKEIDEMKTKNNFFVNRCGVEMESFSLILNIHSIMRRDIAKYQVPCYNHIRWFTHHLWTSLQTIDSTKHSLEHTLGYLMFFIL